MNDLLFNKVCELEDFSHPELLEIIQDAFAHEIGQFPAEYPHGVADSKQWENAMSVRALRHFGALHRQAVILGVGTGTEVTSFYLTRFVQQVFATDLYLNPGVWGDVAPSLMLSEPESFAPYEFERNRLVVQHMDGRLLQYPDNTFDGIFSSGSIEHFDSLDFIANAAFEMGRVLKPGGVMTLSTEFKVAGPPGGDGWDTTTYILSPERIQHYIIEASGLEPVDELHVNLSPQTLQTKRDLVPFLNAIKGKVDWQTKVAYFPNLVLVHEGYVFCSIHLCLRKTERYPVTPNEWARPSEQTRKTVTALTAQIRPPRDRELSEPVLAQFGSESIPDPFPPLFKQWKAAYHRALDSRLAKRLPRPLAYIYCMLLRIRVLPRAWDAQHVLFKSLIDYVLRSRGNSGRKQRC